MSTLRKLVLILISSLNVVDQRGSILFLEIEFYLKFNF